jgi:hypothetical protein
MDDNGAEWEDAVNVSLTRTGHTASAAVQPTGRNAGVGVTNLLNLTTERSSILNLDAVIQICGMSITESLKNQQPHVAEQVRAFVKAKLFLKIKFVNYGDAMFQKAINCVMDQENVAHHKCGSFQMVYESTLNDALNQKQSLCEQAGGGIVRKTIALFKELGEELFTMEELCKLRRSETEREKKAFL